MRHKSNQYNAIHTVHRKWYRNEKNKNDNMKLERLKRNKNMIYQNDAN